LIDLAVQRLSQGTQQYDLNGTWAAQGTPCQPLIDQWLHQDFFQQPPPKSTGRELFGWDYLAQCERDAQSHDLAPADFLATITELSAASIAHSYRMFLPLPPDRILLCGGGSRNRYLHQRIQYHCDPVPVQTTKEFGLCCDFKEAIAFALLAYWYQHRIPGNLPSVTGASQSVVLGNYHPLY
jgi:anhydro-N-acetylmuramic acid kinase